MNQEQKIDDFANDIAMICPDLVESGCGNMNCITCLAEGLVKSRLSRALGRNLYYGDGEWISIDEGLPEDVYGKDREQITVLVYTKGKKVSQCSRCAEYKLVKREPFERDVWRRTGNFYWNKGKEVTHWMPLPEAPKVKGGG